MRAIRARWGGGAVLWLLAFGGAAQAATGLPSSLLKRFASTDAYRIGDEWGKVPVTAESLARESEAFRRAALATARAGGATSFYLGHFGGYHVMATNHHVFPHPSDCDGATIRFPLLGRLFECQTYFGTWTDIDLTLFSIRVPSEADAALLAGVGRSFDFDARLEAGRRLITIGFGSAGNPSRGLVGSQDSDCVVFSGQGEFRFMPDPDAFNPGPYKAWSFSNGCDVSHGDSGSAMVDRESGAVVGIIWTGKIPKSSKVQSSAYLEALLRAPTEDVWTELSYAVPAPRIGEHLRGVAASPGTAPETLRMLTALLTN